MEKNNNKNAIWIVIGAVIFFIAIGSILQSVPGEFAIYAFMGFIPFVIVVIVAVVLSNRKNNNHDSTSVRNTQYNHNKSFYKSEWERLGLSPNDFSVDETKYSKNKNKKTNKSQTPKSTVVFDYEKAAREEKIEVDSILTKVLSESVDEEGKNWKESFNNRLKYTYDPTKDVKDETLIS